VSAGSNAGKAAVTRDLDELAPMFREAVERAIAACKEAGLDAMVYETFRSPELQAAYFARGRTEIPPHATVTNAQSNLASWHGYGLAVDVISRKNGWDQPEDWFSRVAEHFRAAGCRWGGEWKMKDLPHFQWGLCKPSPSPRALELHAQGGAQAVWEVVGAR
jgi:peptidoglycan L-alanyl-D-glutamate endopeptidase CwlK